LGSLRPLLGVRPWTASDFALGATLIAPLESVKPFGVLSLATLTNGLPIPDLTSSLSDSVLLGVPKVVTLVPKVVIVVVVMVVV
jgi:hypothetical protein